MTDGSSSHLTVKIGRSARYNGAVPYDDPESVQYKSWFLWRAPNVRATTPYVYRGVEGATWDGKLSSLVWNIFPEHGQLSDDAQRRFQREIRSYLRATGNAVYLQSSSERVI